MAIENLKLNDGDFSGQDISSLPDRPSDAGITTAQLKARFDQIGKVILGLGRFNRLIDALMSKTAGDSGANNIGVSPIEGISGGNVQAALGEMSALSRNAAAAAEIAAAQGNAAESAAKIAAEATESATEKAAAAETAAQNATVQAREAAVAAQAASTSATNATVAAEGATEAANKATTAANNASDNATAAAAAASAAVQAANTASEQALTASAKADEASTKADTAATQGKAAEQAANSAAAAAQTAASSATNATTAAENAAKAATAATTAANQASEAALAANAKATAAEAAANTATEKAETAITKADEATTKAETAATQGEAAAQAANSAQAAATSAANAANAATNAIVEVKGYADEKAQEAKDYVDNAIIKSGAVTSVFGRAGAIVAQAGDYTAEMVGAPTVEEMEAAIAAKEDTFIATRGETTAEEVMAAINAKKSVFARSGNAFYPLYNYDSGLIRFAATYQSTTTHFTLNRETSAWASGSTSHATKAEVNSKLPNSTTAADIGGIASSEKGVADGVATLDSSGKVPSGQLPSMDYIPTSQKGAAGGVASLNSNGKLVQMPTAADVGAIAAGTTAAQLGGIAATEKGAKSGVATLDSSGKLVQMPTAQDVGAANKSTSATATLLASAWADKTYTLSVSGVTASSNQEILPAVDITQEQLEALQAANIQDGGQSSGKITLKAFGDVPAVDIPIRIILRGDA